MSDQEKTIQDFGDQFLRFQDGHNTGFFGGIDGLKDLLGPLLNPGILNGARVAEIGSGPGRVVNILLDCGAKEVTAVEPSAAFSVLKKNTEKYAGRINYVNDIGTELPLSEYDYVFSVGVLHHIPNVAPVVQRAYEALGQDGQFFVWVYGQEGNEFYLSLSRPLNWITQRLPDSVVTVISFALNIVVSAYIPLCKILPLPMRNHFLNAFSKYTWKQRAIHIFDILNTTYAKYYTKREIYDLLRDAGFNDVRLHHRHGHSWAARGSKTSAP